MIDEYILEVNGISKHYKQAGKKNPFVALDNVSFNIKKGQSIGLVGKNGSGKSTLLKIISGIVSPTDGRIKVNGSIVSLIELGGGMHPDLTGKENIYLYGALLSIPKKNLTAKYEEIVSFSELNDFIDQPLSSYSSGMAMRLGFSVATCIQPDLLLVDEVLGVGDQKFRQKCLKRISNYIKKGTSLVLVHHHFGLVASYCNRGLLLENGKLKVDDNIGELAKTYLKNDSPVKLYNEVKLPKDNSIDSADIEITNSNKERVGDFKRDQAIWLNVKAKIKSKQAMDLILGINIFDADNNLVFPILVQLKQVEDMGGGWVEVNSEIPKELLNIGSYRINYGIYSIVPSHIMYFLEEDAIYFNVNETIEDRNTSFLGKIPGLIRPNIKTTVSKKS